MSAPERIWASSVTENYGEWQTTTDGLPRPTEYVRADLYAALEAQLAERVKVKPLDEDDYEEIVNAAGITLRNTSYGIRGQVITVHDSLDWWVMKETERRILSALEATPPPRELTPAECDMIEGAFLRGVKQSLPTPLVPKVTEAMVEAAERTMAAHYERPLKAWELTALHEALTAAQEEGR